MFVITETYWTCTPIHYTVCIRVCLPTTFCIRAASNVVLYSGVKISAWWCILWVPGIIIQHDSIKTYTYSHPLLQLLYSCTPADYLYYLSSVASSIVVVDIEACSSVEYVQQIVSSHGKYSVLYSVLYSVVQYGIALYILQEAYKMVNEAKAGKILAEKKLADANGKVSV